MKIGDRVITEHGPGTIVTFDDDAVGVEHDTPLLGGHELSGFGSRVACRKSCGWWYLADGLELLEDDRSPH
jgi:hypothetical protein